MTNLEKMPQPFTDISSESWVDRILPEYAIPYAKAMRLDRPIGIWLLLIPGLWSVLAAAKPQDLVFLVSLFTLGAVIMRGAGCIYNDLIDFDIDRMVMRTKTRPIASGQVSFQAAVICVGMLLGLALILLLSLNRVSIFLGFFALIPVAIYPILKRFTYWPQVMLGFAFNWGALLGWSAAHSRISTTAFLLYGAGFCWTMIYDTIYAHQDKEDDLLIGVKSTALKFGRHTPYVLLGFAVVMFLFLYVVGFREEMNVCYFLALFLAFSGTSFQVMYLDYDDPTACLKGFKQQAHIGWLILSGIILGRFL